VWFLFWDRRELGPIDLVQIECRCGDAAGPIFASVCVKPSELPMLALDLGGILSDPLVSLFNLGY
jgi:hypothetical protein